MIFWDRKQNYLSLLDKLLDAVKEIKRQNGVIIDVAKCTEENVGSINKLLERVQKLEEIEAGRQVAAESLKRPAVQAELKRLAGALTEKELGWRQLADDDGDRSLLEHGDWRDVIIELCDTCEALRAERAALQAEHDTWERKAKELAAELEVMKNALALVQKERDELIDRDKWQAARCAADIGALRGQAEQAVRERDEIAEWAAKVWRGGGQVTESMPQAVKERLK